MTIGLQLVLCLACCAPALTATAQPSECASTDTGSELPDLSELRQVLGEAEQAVERLQQAVQRHKSFISGQVRHTQVSKVKSQPEPDYAGSTSALAPFQHTQHRLVAHGLLKWVDGFQLQAAVRTDEPVTAMLPLLAPQSNQAHLLAVGDQGGTVYLFDAQGIQKRELRSGVSSEVTALSHHQVNATSLYLVVGHASGNIQTYAFTLQPRRYGASQEGIKVLDVQLTAQATLRSAAGGVAPVQHLLALKHGPRSMPALVAASAGNASFWYLNGTFLSSVSVPSSIKLVTSSPPYLLLVHEEGISKLLLSSLMGAHPQHPPSNPGKDPVKMHPELTHFTCEGWNGTHITAAAFEASGKGTSRTAARVHALSQAGQLLSITLGSALRGPCMVRHRLPLLAPSPHFPVGMASTPGYTLLAAGPAIAALNESAAVGRLNSGARMVLLDDAQALAASCHQQVESEFPLLLGGSAASAVTVRVAPHVAALFSSTMPGRAAVQRPYWEPFMRPLLMVLAIGVAYWQFGRGRGGASASSAQLEGMLPEELRAALGPEGLRSRGGLASRGSRPRTQDFFDRQLQLGSAARRAYQQGGSRGAATLDRIAADHALGGKESAGEPGHVRDSLRHRGPGVNPMPAEGIFQDDAEM